MTAGWKSEVARRPLLAAVLGLAGLAAIGGIAYEAPSLFRRRYKPTPYDDLLSQLPDREGAAKLGKAAIAQLQADSDVGPVFDAKAVAYELRTGPGKGSLARATAADIAQGRLVEIHGWLLPLSLVLVAGLAAAAQ
jgi:hypothetical protein